MLHWLAHFFGLDNASGAYYLAWSGPAGDLTTLAIVAVIWRHLNCHTPGCKGIAHFPLKGSPYKVCGKCRDKGVKPEHIAEAANGTNGE